MQSQGAYPQGGMELGWCLKRCSKLKPGLEPLYSCVLQSADTCCSSKEAKHPECCSRQIQKRVSADRDWLTHPGSWWGKNLRAGAENVGGTPRHPPQVQWVLQGRENGTPWREYGVTWSVLPSLWPRVAGSLLTLETAWLSGLCTLAALVLPMQKWLIYLFKGMCWEYNVPDEGGPAVHEGDKILALIVE